MSASATPRVSGLGGHQERSGGPAVGGPKVGGRRVGSPAVSATRGCGRGLERAATVGDGVSVGSAGERGGSAAVRGGLVGLVGLVGVGVGAHIAVGVGVAVEARVVAVAVVAGRCSRPRCGCHRHGGGCGRARRWRRGSRARWRRRGARRRVGRTGVVDRTPAQAVGIAGAAPVALAGGRATAAEADRHRTRAQRARRETGSLRRGAEGAGERHGSVFARHADGQDSKARGPWRDGQDATGGERQVDRLLEPSAAALTAGGRGASTRGGSHVALDQEHPPCASPGPSSRMVRRLRPSAEATGRPASMSGGYTATASLVAWPPSSPRPTASSTI